MDDKNDLKDERFYIEREIRIKALKLFKGRCKVCDICDGRGCIGQLPGMGGVFDNRVFIRNFEELRKIEFDLPLLSFYSKNKDLHNNKSFYFNFFGYEVKYPVFIAPITGVKSNMGGGFDEVQFYYSLLKGAIQSDSLAFIGDGSDNSKYLFMDKILQKVDYKGVITLKPRYPIEKLIEKIEYFNKTNIIAISVDVDSYTLPTLKKDYIPGYSVYDILKLKEVSKKPLIIKGIMNYFDMIILAKSGIDSFIISNHGGRVSSSFKSTIEILKEIDIKYLKMIDKKLLIGIDGGFRIGEDVAKALMLGADYVLIGRPFAIYAVGGNTNGVNLYFKKLFSQLDEIEKILSLQ